MSSDREIPPATVADSTSGSSGPMAPAIELGAGDPVGRFVIRDRLGSGGMGVVYLAHDPTIDRNVAVKLIRPGKLTGSMARRGRLLREAQALGKVVHPNVVTVYEAGTVGDEVYIAMEYVSGRTLRAWRAERPRALAEILAVFRSAGEGLLAAHDAGLVHRDFKPENVLVGDDARIRVADFGLAGVAEGEAGAGAGPTEGGAVMGTPRYMSPEQHLGRHVDARGDQFSFAVALHEALAGTAPFPGETIDELRANVLAGNVRALPRTVPRRIARAIERALRRDPDERWPSMAALLHALAQPPLVTPGRAALGVGAVALVAVAAWGLVGRAQRPCRDAERKLQGAWDAAARSGVAERVLATGRPGAAQELTRLEQALDRYAAAWLAMRTDACEATVRREQSEATLDLRMSCLDRRAAALRALVTALARDPGPAGQAVSAALRLERIDDCADAAALAATEPLPPRDLRVPVEALRQKLDEVTALQQLGNIKAARRAEAPLVDEARRLGYVPLLARALYARGMLLLDTDLAAAETVFNEALALAGEAKNDVLMARIQIAHLGLLATYQQRRAEALALRPVVDGTVRRAGNADALRGSYLKEVATLLFHDGKYAEALDSLEQARAAMERALGADSVDVARLHVKTAMVYSKIERLPEARQHAEKALAMLEQALGPDTVPVGEVVNILGIVAARSKDFETARRHFERTLHIDEVNSGPMSANVATLTYNLGQLSMTMGLHDDARRYFERSLAVREKILDRDHPDLALSLMSLAENHLKTGDAAAARPLLERALAIQEKRLAPDHPDLGYTLDRLAHAYIEEKRPVEALPFIERSVAIRAKAFGPTHPYTVQTQAYLAGTQVKAGRVAEALRWLEGAAASFRPDTDPDVVAAVELELARALRAAGRERARSLALARRARDHAVRAGDVDGVKEIDAWLAER